MTETTGYEMYPHKECFVCGKKWVIDHMGTIDGQHACPEHYNSIINTYGINVTMKELKEGNLKLKSYYNYFVKSINKLAKYEKHYNVKLISRVQQKHKEMIQQQGKEVNTITREENDKILHCLMEEYLPSLVVPLKEEELKNIYIDKSYYSIYYESLTGKKSKSRGGDNWLL